MKILLPVLSILVVSLLHSSQCQIFGDLPSPPLKPPPPPLPPRRISECYYEPENRTLAIGETFTPKERCVLATCLEDGTLRDLWCGGGPKCKNPRIEHEDYTKPFPDCCEKVHCE